MLIKFQIDLNFFCYILNQNVWFSPIQGLNGGNWTFFSWPLFNLTWSFLLNHIYMEMSFGGVVFIKYVYCCGCIKQQRRDEASVYWSSRDSQLSPLNTFSFFVFPEDNKDFLAATTVTADISTMEHHRKLRVESIKRWWREKSIHQENFLLETWTRRRAVIVVISAGSHTFKVSLPPQVVRSSSSTCRWSLSASSTPTNPVENFVCLMLSNLKELMDTTAKQNWSCE